jgi:hypothetical protein
MTRSYATLNWVCPLHHSYNDITVAAGGQLRPVSCAYPVRACRVGLSVTPRDGQTNLEFHSQWTRNWSSRFCTRH